jgi:hypothetical protein
MVGAAAVVDCFGAVRLAMTEGGRHCEPEAKQSMSLAPSVVGCFGPAGHAMTVDG